MRITFTMVLGTVTAIGAMLLASPEAAADEMGYLQYIEDHGMNVVGPSSAVRVGHAVCTALDEGASGAQIALYIYRNVSWASKEDSAHIVVGAVLELCPEYVNDLRAGGTSSTQQRGFAT